MRRIAFFAVTAVILAAFPAQAQSLNETFDWMSNTLKLAEGNNYYVHHPFPDRSQNNLEDGVNVVLALHGFTHPLPCKCVYLDLMTPLLDRRWVVDARDWLAISLAGRMELLEVEEASAGLHLSSHL